LRLVTCDESCFRIIPKFLCKNIPIFSRFCVKNVLYSE